MPQKQIELELFIQKFNAKQDYPCINCDKRIMKGNKIDCLCIKVGEWYKNLGFYFLSHYHLIPKGKIKDYVEIDVMKMRFIALQVIEKEIYKIKTKQLLKELPKIISNLPEKIAHALTQSTPIKVKNGTNNQK